MAATAVLRHSETPTRFEPVESPSRQVSSLALTASSPQAAPALPSPQQIQIQRTSPTEEILSQEMRRMLHLALDYTDLTFEGVFASTYNALGTAFPGITIEKELGQGSFATVFLMQGNGIQGVLRVLDYNQAMKNPQICALTPPRVGGEWLAFFLEGEHMVETSHIVAYQEQTREYYLVTKEDFLTYDALKQKADQGDDEATRLLSQNPIHQALLKGPLTAISTLSRYYEGTCELVDYIGQNEARTPAQIKEISRQLLEAINELHTKRPGFVHRNLKPENILFQKPSPEWPEGRILIFDTGLSRILPKEKNRLSFPGTPAYGAFEMLLQASPESNGQYGQKVDVHSLFYTLYHLTTNRLRFSFDDPKKFEQKQTREEFRQNQFPLQSKIDPSNPQHLYMKKRFTKLNPAMADDDLFIDFLLRISQMDPEKRPSAAEALKHPFFTGVSEPAEAAASSSK